MRLTIAVTHSHPYTGRQTTRIPIAGKNFKILPSGKGDSRMVDPAARPAFTGPRKEYADQLLS